MIHPARKQLVSHPVAMACSICSVLLAAVLLPQFLCICGHLDAAALGVSATLAGLAWFGYLTSSLNDLFSRGVRAVAVVLVTMALLKNLTDVLWLGHCPVF